jgi:uncharacterized protein with WD repeat
LTQTKIGKCDSLEFYWNKNGTNLIFSSFIENSDNSYYGESKLYIMDLNGNSNFIYLKKKGKKLKLKKKV